MKIKKPRVKAKEIRLQEIQTAARKVFFKKGYQNSTIGEIAKLAGIREGTVYLYFKNKEDLYISLMIPVTQRIGEQLQKLENADLNKIFKNGSQLMETLTNIYLDLHQYDPDGLKIIQAYQQGNLFLGMSTAIRKKLDDLAHNNFETVRRIISKAKNLGFFREDVDGTVLADILWSLFIGAVQLEETKLRATQKNHLQPTIKYAFSLITRAILPESAK